MSKMLYKTLSTFVVTAVAFGMTFASAGAAFDAATLAMFSQLGLTDAQIELLADLMDGDMPAVETEAQPSGYVHTMTLSVGASGAQVMAAQSALNCNGAMLAVDGAFGPATASAVMNFQGANGLVMDGVIGPMTGSYLVNCPGSGDPIDMEEDDDEVDFVLSGGEEGELEDFDVDDEDDVQNEEQNVEVLSGTFEFTDADVLLERADFVFDGTAADEDEPWDVFEEIAFFVNGSEVASVDADDEDEWNEIGSTDTYRLRFSGLSEVSEEDEESDFSLEVSVGDVDDLPEPWVVSVNEDAFRFVDTAGITLYAPESDFDIDVDIESQDDATITLSESNDNPEETILLAEENDTSDDYLVFVMDMEIEDQDVEIDEMVFTLTEDDGAVDIDDIIDEVYLEIDGEKYDDYDWNGDDAEFDLDETKFDEGEYEVEVYVSLKEQGDVGSEDYAPGTTLDVDYTSMDAEVTPDDDIAINENGSPSSETHSIFTVVPVVTLESVDIEKTYTAESGTDEGDQATITYEFEVEAIGDNVWVDLDDYAYSITGGTDPAATAVDVFDSTNLDAGTNGYEVEENSTGVFTLEIVITADADDFYSVQFDSIDWIAGDVDLDGDQTLTAGFDEDWETDNIFLNFASS